MKEMLTVLAVMAVGISQQKKHPTIAFYSVIGGVALGAYLLSTKTNFYNSNAPAAAGVRG